MSRDVLRRVVAEAGVKPAGKRGGHPVYRLKDVYDAIEADRDTDRMNPYARHALAKAILAEDEIRVRRGELLESHDVEYQFGQVFKLVALAYETATDCCERDAGLTRQQATYLDEFFNKQRENLYKAVIEYANNESGTAGDDREGEAEE